MSQRGEQQIHYFAVSPSVCVVKRNKKRHQPFLLWRVILSSSRIWRGGDKGFLIGTITGILLGRWSKCDQVLGLYVQFNDGNR